MRGTGCRDHLLGRRRPRTDAIQTVRQKNRPVGLCGTYTLGGDVLGLGTKILPNGAAVIKQVVSTSIANTASTKAVAVLVGAIQS